MPEDSEAQVTPVRANVTVGPIDDVTVIDGMDGDEMLTLRFKAGTSTIDIIGPMRGKRVAGGDYVPGLYDMLIELDKRMAELARPSVVT